MTPLALFGAALELGAGAQLMACDEAGGSWSLPVARWLAAATDTDERLLDRATGPVLDIGCGPGRHVHALMRRGVTAMGVDVSPVAVRLARERGARALERSVFDRLPGTGTWRTVLLLDGNIGIGGSPEALLQRASALMAAGGTALVELAPPGRRAGTRRLRLRHDGRRSAPFAWAQVPADAIAGPAGAAGMSVTETWEDGGRWFSELHTR